MDCYKDKCGSMVLMDIPTDVNAKVTMKIGLKIENIFPQIIMEWPGFVLHENA